MSSGGMGKRHLLFKGPHSQEVKNGRKYFCNFTASKSGSKWNIPEESKPSIRREVGGGFGEGEINRGHLGDFLTQRKKLNGF